MHPEDLSVEIKITEKRFRTVLISSVCSILLCMACLAGTSWAWFYAGIENTENVIQIAPATLETQVTRGGETVTPNEDGSYSLPAGEYQLQVTLDRGDDPGCAAYFVATVRQDKPERYLLIFHANPTKEQQLNLCVHEGTAEVSFQLSWVYPGKVTVVNPGDTISVGQPPVAPPDAGGDAPADPALPESGAETADPPDAPQP